MIESRKGADHQGWKENQTTKEGRRLLRLKASATDETFSMILQHNFHVQRSAISAKEDAHNSFEVIPIKHGCTSKRTKNIKTTDAKILDKMFI